MEQKNSNINIEETLDVNNSEITGSIESKSIAKDFDNRHSVTQEWEQEPSPSPLTRTNTISSTSPQAPPALTEAYYKGRRSYGFYCAVLFVWMLLGINITGEQMSFITMQNPNVIVYVVLSLLVYFAFRTSIEWYQCHEDSREQYVASIDFYIAHVIGISVLLLYLTQYLGIFNIVDYL